MIDIESMIETLEEFKRYAENMQFGDEKPVNEAFAKLRSVLDNAVDAAIAVNIARHTHEINDADMDRENFDSDEDFEKAQF